MKLTLTLIITSLAFVNSFSQNSPLAWGVDESKYLPQGLSSGDKAPNFITEDVNGKGIELNSLIEKGKVVVLFYRGQWCPVCEKHLSAFQEEVSQILDKGASVIAVTPETIDNAKVMMGKTGMTFSVIADPDGQIMKDYDVLFHVTDKYEKKIASLFNTDIAENNASQEALLPVPATYIINQNGIIEKVFFNYNYKIRASVSEILEVL